MDLISASLLIHTPVSDDKTKQSPLKDGMTRNDLWIVAYEVLNIAAMTGIFYHFSSAVRCSMSRNAADSLKAMEMQYEGHIRESAQYMINSLENCTPPRDHLIYLVGFVALSVFAHYKISKFQPESFQAQWAKNSAWISTFLIGAPYGFRLSLGH